MSPDKIDLVLDPGEQGNAYRWRATRRIDHRMREKLIAEANEALPPGTRFEVRRDPDGPPGPHSASMCWYHHPDMILQKDWPDDWIRRRNGYFYSSHTTKGEVGMPDDDNIMRHQYRDLSDADKLAMEKIKDMGSAFHTLIDTYGPSREISLAKTKVEEAVFWAVKHVTG